MRNARKLISHLLLIIIFSFSSSLASVADGIPSKFTFHGAGYGHGVGMSQIGARGLALQGSNAIEILQYFYKDVSVEDIKDDQNLRINIGHLVSIFSLRTETQSAQIQIYAGDIKDSTSATPIKILPAKASLNFTLLGNSAIPSVTTTTGVVEPLASGKSWTIRWSGTRYLSGSNAVVTLKNGNSNAKYRYGQIQVKLVKVSLLGYRIEITNSVRLHDEYLWGIGEVPSSWPFAALQAQAIASRTYALNKLGKIRVACDCDLYNASQDQAFIGYSKESEPKYGKIWKSAVSSTSVESDTGLAVLYKSRPIGTFFFSSSGGQTESAKNAWGTDLPYLASVDDPWSLDPTINPRYFDWVREVNQSLLATIFGLPDVVFIEVLGLHDSSTQLKIAGTSSSGKRIVITGEQFRSRTRLPSAWFEVVGPEIIEASPSPSPTPTQSVSPSTSPSPTELTTPSGSPSVGVQDGVQPAPSASS